MALPPTGTVTLLFTDIEGSTRLAQMLGDRYADLLETHRRLIRKAVDDHGGYEFETQGDGIFVAFSSARDALAAAVAAQLALHGHSWPEGAPVRVRMAIHTGHPIVANRGYVGLDLHRVARICQAGHGEQVLVSKPARDLVDERIPPGTTMIDLGEHKLKGLQQPEHLYQISIANMQREFPPLRSLQPHRHNLPVQTTSFIGREKETAEVRRALGQSRLVTLTGAGGCGKTRLALRVAADILETQADGVWFVDLSTIDQPSMVSQTIATEVNVREEPGRSLLDTLADNLRPKQLVIVLDNCEHLLSVCAQSVQRLLRAGPRVSVLATSREPLRVNGELVFQVPSLAVPDLRRPPDFETLARCEAVQLFDARAKLLVPTFTLTGSRGLTVARICRRLDGIPLAIELAARWVHVLTVDQIEARLDDWFRLLKGGSTTAHPRHRTLLAALEWSHDLLSLPERTLFRRVAVFAGGFTLDAAEAVCLANEPDYDVLDLLTLLIDRSLVIARDWGEHKRYQVLQIIRQYGWQKLLDSGEASEVQERHCEWYTRYGMTMKDHLHGRRQGKWPEYLEAEHDNLRAAMGWSLQSTQPESCLHLASSVWPYWAVRGFYAEGRRWLEKALFTNDAAPLDLRAEALSGLGDLATHQGDHPAAIVYLEESLALWESLQQPQGIASTLNLLGNVAWRQGKLERATALYKQALVIFERLTDENSIASLLNNLGVLASLRGEFAEARSLLERCLESKKRLDSRRGIAMAAGNLGVAAFRQGDYATARAFILESLAIDRELKDARGSTSELEALGLVAAAQGQMEWAARILGAAEASRETVEAPLSVAERTIYDYDRHLTAIRQTLGHTRMASVWAEGREMGLEEAIEYALTEAVFAGDLTSL